LLLIGESGNPLGQILPVLGLNALAGGVRAVRAEWQVVQIDLRPTLPEVVQRLAAGDHEKPGGKPTPVPVARQSFQRAQERLGGQVFRHPRLLESAWHAPLVKRNSPPKRDKQAPRLRMSRHAKAPREPSPARLLRLQGECVLH